MVKPYDEVGIDPCVANSEAYRSWYEIKTQDGYDETCNKYDEVRS